jgi:hypothetical protein
MPTVTSKSNCDKRMPSTMNVLLDDQPCQFDAASVGEAITAAASLAEARGRMIVEVLVDGRALSQSDLDEPSNQTMRGSAGEVRLSSALPTELVRATFQDAAGALSEADALQQSAAGMIQAGQVTQAMDKLAEALSIWSSVQQALVLGAPAAGINLETELAAIGREQALSQLNQHLKAIRDALQTRDPVGLADTLLYDLPDVVSQWRSLLHALAERLASPR